MPFFLYFLVLKNFLNIFFAQVGKCYAITRKYSSHGGPIICKQFQNKLCDMLSDAWNTWLGFDHRKKIYPSFECISTRHRCWQSNTNTGRSAQVRGEAQKYAAKRTGTRRSAQDLHFFQISKSKIKFQRGLFTVKSFQKTQKIGHQ